MCGHCCRIPQYTYHVFCCGTMIFLVTSLSCTVSTKCKESDSYILYIMAGTCLLLFCCALALGHNCSQQTVYPTLITPNRSSNKYHSVCNNGDDNLV